MLQISMLEECRLDDFMSGARPLVQSSTRLPAHTLEVTRMADANRAQPSGSAVSSVEFHPSGQLLLTAGLDRRLHFFQVRPRLRRCRHQHLVAGARRARGLCMCEGEQAPA